MEPRKFITVLTSARQLSLSWANSIQSPQPLPTSWRPVLILSSHLCLCLPNSLFSSGFPTKTLYTPLPSSIRATCPAHLILLGFITRTILGEECRSFSSSVQYIYSLYNGYGNCIINKYIRSASWWSIYIIGYDGRYTQRQINSTRISNMKAWCETFTSHKQNNCSA